MDKDKDKDLELWVVIGSSDDGYYTLLGVYSSLKAAQRLVDTHDFFPNVTIHNAFLNT